MPQRTAIVTGAGTGIGRAAALALARAGYAVVLAGRRQDTLKQVAAEAAADGATALPIVTDITSPESVKALFDETKRSFGRLDVLFNNAGIGTPERMPDEMSIEEWRACIDTVLTGSFLCAREAFKLMREQSPRGGRIINNGSVSSHAPRPGACAYTAAKHGITGLTKSLGLDGRAFDIACSQIDIGNAATELTQRIALGARQADGSLATEPLFDVKYVADAVVNIASLPLDVNVAFMTIMATKMPLIGRG